VNLKEVNFFIHNIINNKNPNTTQHIKKSTKLILNFVYIYIKNQTTNLGINPPWEHPGIGIN
jgi:hypothetical protein